MPVTQLEKTAKPLAGRRTVTPSARAAVAEAAGQQGTWSPVTNTGVVPVFTAVLPNGKVLMWDSVGDGPTESYPNHTFTRALVYDPATGTQTRVDLSGSNIFCAGFVHLADGRVFIAGGNKDSALNGTNLTHIFDWNTNTWTRGPNMSGARWYPSVAALMDDQALVVGGGPAPADLRQTDGAVRALSGVTAPATRDYPHIQSQPDGRTLYTGPESLMRLWSVQGSGTTTPTGNRDSGYRGYSSYAQYRPGLTLVSGGSGSPQPLASSVIVDRRDVTTKVTAGASTANPRMQHNLTVLPDGSLLATGGLSRLGDNNNGLVSLANPVYAAERWSPETNTWASAVVPRQYHSTATLLPDGRILTGGGGICGEYQRVGYLQKNIEIFTPPYLYAKDGSGALAARPSVSGVPARVLVDAPFTFTSPQADRIAKVGLIRLGAVTHSEDQGQRYVPLSFTRSGTTLTVTGPPNTAQAPGGYYMLAVVDADGVPAVSPIVKVNRPAASAVTNPGARTSGPAAVLAVDGGLGGVTQPIEAGVWRASDGGLGTIGVNRLSSVDVAAGWRLPACSEDSLSGSCVVVGPGRTDLTDFNDRARSVRVSPADGTEPKPPAVTAKKIVHSSSGQCLSTPSLTAETATTTSACSNAQGQRWEVAAGGAGGAAVAVKIAGTNTCLDVRGGSTSNGTRVQVYPCHGGGSQSWEVRSDGTVRNPQSGKCLTRVTSWFSATRVEISSCWGLSSQSGPSRTPDSAHAGPGMLWRLMPS